MYIHAYIVDADLVKIFKALGDETRLQIVEYLLLEEQCACDFVKCFNKDQSTVSRHLKILEESKILRTEKRGRNVIYKIRNEEMKKLLRNFGLKPSNKCCFEVQNNE